MNEPTPQWTIRVEGKEYGPADLATLREWKEDGRVLSTNEARRSEEETWMRAGEIPGLFAATPPQPPPVQIILPEGAKIAPEDIGDNAFKVYKIPANSRVHTEPVSRWDLALVISQAVAVICLWGTLVGSMLPLIFRRLGVDPGIASSPFVATFVDVTGIVIYFSIASIYLL